MLLRRGIEKQVARDHIAVSPHTVMDFKIADEVIVKIRNSHIVDRYATNFDKLQTLEIVALFESGYFVYIPQDEFVKDSVKIELYNHKRFNVPTRYIDSYVCFINDDRIVRLYHRRIGMKCRHCNEFYQYAESNQANGTLLCWSCKQNPYR